VKEINLNLYTGTPTKGWGASMKQGLQHNYLYSAVMEKLGDSCFLEGKRGLASVKFSNVSNKNKFQLSET